MNFKGSILKMFFDSLSIFIILWYKPNKSSIYAICCFPFHFYFNVDDSDPLLYAEDSARRCDRDKCDSGRLW